MLVKKLHEKWPTGKQTRWEDNIKIDFRETGCEDCTWMELAQDHVQWWILELVKLNWCCSFTDTFIWE
jgi:hypothetical protein